MRNIIAFERGKSPKEGLGIGIEPMKKKHGILVIETEFHDVGVAAQSLFEADTFGKFNVGRSKAMLESNFVIIKNEDVFRIIKSRYAPAYSEMSPSSTSEFFQSWNYPASRLNDCIMWMAKESENWERKEDDYGFKL